MTKTVRKSGTRRTDIRWSACLLAILLLWGMPAMADDLLEAMVDIALRSGKAIEGTMRIEADGLLAILSAEAEGEQTLALARDLLDNGLIRVRYATQDGSHSVIGAALELRGETILSLEARLAGEEITLETSLLPGKTLVVPAQIVALLFPAKTTGIADSTLIKTLLPGLVRYEALVESWLARNEGMISVREEPTPATKTRDAVIRTMTLRVTDVQLQDLVRSLAEEFSTDTVLQQLLASRMSGMEPAALAEAALQLVGPLATPQGAPKGVVMEITVLLGEYDQICGIDARIEPLQSSFAYDYRSVLIDDDHVGEAQRVSLVWDGGAELQAQLYWQEKVPNRLRPQEGEEYGGRALLRMPDDSALELEARGDITKTVEPITESFDNSFNIRLGLRDDASDTRPLSQVLQTPLLDAGFTATNQTKVIELEDFRSHGALTLELMGSEATFHYTLESIEFRPQEHPENVVLRLDALTQAETEALAQELLRNVKQLLERAHASSVKRPQGRIN